MKKTGILLALLASFSLGAQTKTITLEDVWKNNTFGASSVGGFRSMNDGMHYTAYKKDTAKGDDLLMKYDFATGKEAGEVYRFSELVPEGSTTPIKPSDYVFSPDETAVLIVTEAERIYRYSTREENYVFDLKTRKLKKLSNGGKQSFAAFSPDGKKIAFMRSNNVFVYDVASATETAITTDGERNKIINGGMDWAYEEEFTLKTGMQWSPDSKYLAFYRFDESAVKEFSFPVYSGNLYTDPYTYKYPKAGETISTVSIWIHDIAAGKHIQADIGKETDQYIPRITWMEENGRLCIMRMNRKQNQVDLLQTDAATGSSSVFFTETSNTYVDIEATDHLTFLPDRKNFIWCSDMDGHQHLYVKSIDGKKSLQITKGNYDVIEYYGYDSESKQVFYLTNEESPEKRALYTVKIDGKGKKKLSERSGSNAPDFSSGMKYYVNTFSDANTPYICTLHDKTGKQIKVLKENKGTIAKMKDYGFQRKEFFWIHTAGGVDLRAWMIKPQQFDSTKKYPVYMFVYGGPGRCTVVDEWGRSDFAWHEFLAQKGYIVVSVDNRGTEYRGRDFKKCTYGQLGKLETEDQVNAAKYLKSLGYVDSTRVGIQGWSYGGFMASNGMMRTPGVFKCGVAVAPVSNWRYYDAIYTERFMGLPKENGKGYDENAPLTYAANLQGKFLLIHGTGDDNVHFQNTADLVTALQKANKQFDFMIYPDKNHSIVGGYSRLNLYTKVWNFIQANL